jgi:hypothetical protein
MVKAGDFYLVSKKGRCVAYWRPVDGSRDVFLAAADLSACDRHPHLRKLLIEPACETVINRERKAGDSITMLAPRAVPAPPGARPAA